MTKTKKNQFLYTTCSKLEFLGEFNEQSLVTLRMRASEKDLPVHKLVLLFQQSRQQVLRDYCPNIYCNVLSLDLLTIQLSEEIIYVLIIV